jgi:predicted transcriptional regulator
MDAEINPFSADDGPTTTRSRMSGLLRATQVLDRLVVEGKATSAYDLAKAIHAPVSTIYGVVDALVQAGLLERDTTGAVWFGSRMYHYGLAYGRNVDLLREARTEMRRLAHDLGETVQSCARHEGHVVIQDMAEASRAASALAFRSTGAFQADFSSPIFRSRSSWRSSGIMPCRRRPAAHRSTRASSSHFARKPAVLAMQAS